jgi:putative acetyltransferase
MIRKYKADDLEAVIDTWYQASMVAHPFLDSTFIEQEKHNIQYVYLPNTETWVFEKNNEIVAFIAMIDNEVVAIFAKPPFHGTGIGKQLMDYVADMHPTLEVEVFENNRIGRVFYEKYGFSQMEKHLHEETGFYLLRLKYEKNK